MTYVLVHGSWHNGTAWGKVADHLRSHGETVHTPTVAGHGKGVAKNISHAESVQSIVDYINAEQLENVVLLGHSYGGTIISKAVEQLPNRVKRLIFWNAFVLQDGESLADNTPPHYRGLFDHLAATSGDNTIMLPFPIWREAFMNDSDLELATACYDLLSPEPNQFNEKLDLKVFYNLIQTQQVACSYLNCTEDIALPPGEWAWHPRMSSRLGLYRLVQMPGSHEVCFSNPKLLAEKIIEAGRD